MKLRMVLGLVLLTGCAGMQRDCKASCNSSLGADWIVVQYDQLGVPFNCWKLTNASLTSEKGSDGVFWQDTSNGHMVHVGGWYNHVQVDHGDFAQAASSIGIDINKCIGGHYKDVPDGH